jgi:hypothetical protein
MSVGRVVPTGFLWRKTGLMCAIHATGRAVSRDASCVAKMAGGLNPIPRIIKNCVGA